MRYSIWLCEFGINSSNCTLNLNPECAVFWVLFFRLSWIFSSDYACAIFLLLFNYFSMSMFVIVNVNVMIVVLILREKKGRDNNWCALDVQSWWFFGCALL